jgi:hypothetical protein
LPNIVSAAAQKVTLQKGCQRSIGFLIEDPRYASNGYRHQQMFAVMT